MTEITKKTWPLITFVVTFLNVLKFCKVKHLYVFTHIYISVYIYMYIYVCVYTHTHTHIYIYMKWSESGSAVTLFDPMDCIVHGILQARILEWVAFPFSRGSSQPRDRTQVSSIAGRSSPAEPQGKPIYMCMCLCVCVYTYIYHPTTKCSFDSVCRLVSRGHYMIKFSTNSCPWNHRTQIWVVCPYGLCYLYILTVFSSLLLPPHYLTQDSLEINFTN